MPLSSSKKIKKSKNIMTPTEKAEFQLDNLESLIHIRLTNLETIEQEIQQENYDDSQYIEEKYKCMLVKMLEEYRNLSKKVNQLQCKSIFNK